MRRKLWVSIVLFICILIGGSYYYQIAITEKPLGNTETLQAEDINLQFLSNLHTLGSFRLPTTFDHHMVLQREPKNAKIWGWCDADDELCQVIVELNGNSYKATVEGTQKVIPTSTMNQTKWIVELPPQPAGGPHQILIRDSSFRALELRDVYFGDVYTCAGQSNMLFTVGQTFKDRNKKERFDFPKIRIMSVGRHDSTEEANDVVPELHWSVASESVLRFQGDEWEYFSAVCWYFGKALFEETNAPIGLIATAVNGSPLQTWAPDDVMEFCGREERAIFECCPTQDSVSWNAMIHPLLDLSIRGVLFYQGESNLNGPSAYTCIFPLFVEAWRNKTSYDLPFITTEIAPLFYNNGPVNDFRKVQHDFTNEMDWVYIVDTLDLGDIHGAYSDLHPRFKEDIGERMKDVALKEIYFEDIVAYGPQVQTITVKTNGYKETVEIIYREDTVGDGIKLTRNECEWDSYRLKDYPISDFCTDFEVIFEDFIFVPSFENLEIVSRNTLRFSYNLNNINQNPSVTGRTVNYAWSSYPNAIVFNSVRKPAAAFSYDVQSQIL